MQQLKDINSVENFEFPYLYKFAGQASDERILFVTRESELLLRLRRFVVVVVSIAISLVGFYFVDAVSSFIGSNNITTEVSYSGIKMFIFSISILFILVGWFWVGSLWRKSLAFVTNKRLKKIIYTTPFNKHSLSLPLEMIVDTGSYSKGFLSAFFDIGVFTARSSASSSGVATDDNERVNKKYFYIENVTHVEDLQHYVSKVLSAFRKYPEKMETFRPFIPNLKGDKRKAFMEQFPEYWS